MPDRLELRQIKVRVDQPGFRVSSFYIVTTLLDADKYPASEIADLYFQRWDVELFFRDIKTTMGMDILRCKTPSMVRKELLMHLIAYNCLRNLMLESADKKGVAVRRISFETNPSDNSVDETTETQGGGGAINLGILLLLVLIRWSVRSRSAMSLARDKS